VVSSVTSSSPTPTTAPPPRLPFRSGPLGFGFPFTRATCTFLSSVASVCFHTRATCQSSKSLTHHARLLKYSISDFAEKYQHAQPSFSPVLTRTYHDAEEASESEWPLLFVSFDFDSWDHGMRTRGGRNKQGLLSYAPQVTTCSEICGKSETPIPEIHWTGPDAKKS
jgi:hypothetical protein